MTKWQWFQVIFGAVLAAGILVMAVTVIALWKLQAYGVNL